MESIGNQHGTIGNCKDSAYVSNRKETHRHPEGRQGRHPAWRRRRSRARRASCGSRCRPASASRSTAISCTRARCARIPELGKFHGLARSLVANAVRGVTEGFRKDLDIVGVGYRAELKGKQVVFALGYSHAVVFDIPHGNRHRHRQADAHHRDRHRSPGGRTGGGEHPAAAEARSVQAEGRPLHRRSAEEEGGKDGGEVEAPPS